MSTSSVIESSPLLRLPGELRNAIFSDLLTRQPNPNRIVIHDVEPNTHSTIGHPLTQTCQQLRKDFRLFHSSEAPAWVEIVSFKCRNNEIFNLRAALARLPPKKIDGGWRDIEVQLIVDHDTFRGYGHMIRKLVWEEDPTAAFGVDILQCLKITLHEDITLDDLETAMEVFSLDKAYYLSQGHDAARADRRWSCVKSAIRTAVFQRDGLLLLDGPGYGLRKAKREAKRIRAQHSDDKTDA